MKDKKIGRFAAIMAALFAVLFCFTACDKKPSGGTLTPSDGDEDPHVIELTITTPPSKLEYRPGETFDSSGMTLEATWSHKDDDGNNIAEDLMPTECEISPSGVLQSGTTSIIFTYEGASVSQPIQMADVEIQSIALDKSGLSRWLTEGIVDLTAAKIIINYDDGQFAYASDCKVSADGAGLKNPEAWQATVGRHVIEYAFDDFSEEIMLDIRDSTRIISKNLVASDDIKADPDKYVGKNFIEKPNYKADGITKSNYKSNYIAAWGNVEILYEVESGDIVRYHIYSDKARDCELVLNAASQYTIDGNEMWVPTKMGDMEIGKCFNVNVVTQNGDSETKTPHAIDATAFFPGGESDVPDSSLGNKFTDVSLGRFSLHEGDNIIELTMTLDEYPNKWGCRRAPNIAHLKIFYINSDSEVCDEHDLRKHERIVTRCGNRASNEYYECITCAGMFADAQAEQTIYNVPSYVMNHTPDEAHPATCIQRQKCKSCGAEVGELAAHKFNSTNCEVENECTVCHTTIPAGHILHVDGIVKSCDRCGVVGYQIDVDDRQHIFYEKADGTAIWKGISRPAVGENNTTLATLGGMDNADWKGAYIRLKFNAPEAGRYVLRMRGRSMGDSGTGNQDLSKVWEYCVNPESNDTSAYTYSSVKGIVNPSTDLGVGWQNFSNFSICNLGDVTLKEGDNEIVLHFKEPFNRGPDINYFAIERADYKYALGAEAEVISLRYGGFDYEQGYENAIISNYNKKFVNHIYVRLMVPEDKVDEFGVEFYAVGISEDMLPGGKFDTSTVGEHSVEFDLTKFGKTYHITFKYNVYAKTE